MSRLKLGLLGPPQVQVDDIPVEIKSRKALALLAYLALSDDVQRRDSLATLLWPDSTQRRARASLRRDLSKLNKLLGGNWLQTERETAALRHSPDLDLDVAQFQAYLAACQDHDHPPEAVCPDCLPLLAKAAALYRADFLSGFTLSDSVEFDDWQYFQAESLRQELGSALDRLVQGYRQQGDLKTAIGYARRRLTLDPQHEPAHQALMRLYAQSGQQAAALRQYQVCKGMLQTEFGTSPAPETEALYEQIRSGKRLTDTPTTAQASPPDFLIGGRYEIIDQAEDLVGHGSMGHVFKGRDTHSGKTVAIKALRNDLLADESEWVERFAREGAALRQLNHPNIAQLLDVIAGEEQHYLVMDYVPGGSLQELLDRSGPLPLARVLQLGLEMVDALTQTHYQGIVHRDIKPANILLDVSGRPQLTDFGVARLGQAERLTQTGAVIGTLDYLSPEALNGIDVDVRTDIWSLGVLLYELLAQTRPFTGETLTEVLTAILTRPAPDLAALRPDTPPALVALIGRMLRKEPAERIGSVRQVGAELESIMQAVQAGTPADGRSMTDLYPQARSQALTPRHNLPAQPTSFVGRTEDLAQIITRLAEPNCRLLTLVGPGGVGKTRLALQTAQVLIDQPPAGIPASLRIIFVPLAGLESADGLVAAIAGALDFSFYGETDPKAQLLAYLREKMVLLILDNFEHLLDGAPLVSEILAAAAGVTVLATSREPLNLAEEWLQPVDGMAYPADDAISPLGSDTYSALDLFAERADRVAPDFSLAEEYPEVVRICRLVGGLPLGLELAAARRRQFSCETIVTQIEVGLDFLVTNLRNVPERHRSIRAVFESSWELLSEREQAILSKLSVFRGGFQLEAAEAVAEAGLTELTDLVDKSLLRVSPQGRYDLHELLRQFAQIKLEIRSTESVATQARHGRYYLNFVADRDSDLKGGRQQAALAEIGNELDNIQRAWYYAVSNVDIALLSRATDALGIFYEWRGYYQAGTSAFQVASSQLAAGSGNNDMLRVLSKVLVWQSIFTRLQRRIPTIDEWLKQSLRILETLEMSGETVAQEKAFTLLQLGFEKYDLDPQQARQLGQQSLALYQALNDRWGAANALFLLGEAGFYLPDYQARVDYHEEGLKLRRKLNDRRGIARSLQMLAKAVQMYHWDIEKGAHLIRESIVIQREIGDRAGLADGLIGQGSAFTNLGKFAEAEPHFHESQRIALDLGNKDILGGAHTWLADLLKHQGHYERASREAQACLTLAPEIWGGPTRSALIILAQIRLAQGDYYKAGQLLQEDAASLDGQIAICLSARLTYNLS